MSMGIGAHAKKIAEDETVVMYEYCGYNLNDPQYRNEEYLHDGTIMIQKECFVGPEIHEKLKKLPNGKKEIIVKRIPISVNYEEMIENGRIVIENCSNCWHTTMGDLHVDIMACRLLFYIFLQYQEKGTIPQSFSYYE